MIFHCTNKADCYF